MDSTVDTSGIIGTLTSIFNSLGSTSFNVPKEIYGTASFITIHNDKELISYTDSIYKKYGYEALKRWVEFLKLRSSVNDILAGLFFKHAYTVVKSYFDKVNALITQMNQPTNMGNDGLNTTTPTQTTTPVQNPETLIWLKIMLMGPFAPLILGLGKVKNG